MLSLSKEIAPSLAGCRWQSDKKVGVRNVKAAIARRMVLAVTTNGWLDQGRGGVLMSVVMQRVGQDYLAGKVQRSPMAIGQSQLTL